MKRYMAPMEGITVFIFRNAFNHYYTGIDKFFAPFAAPIDNCDLTPKERRDILPENNKGLRLVPQILTCKSAHFINCANSIIDMGYDEINLNLGCPSGTVVTKGKGSGFLVNTEELDRFLFDIYEYGAKKNIEISVKTRVGRYDTAEWSSLMDIFNKYPISELIVHPRLTIDYYKGEPRAELYQYAKEVSKVPLVYNGNIFSKADILRLNKKEDIMLGRGIIARPDMLMDEEFDLGKFMSFHDEIYHGYQSIMAPDINVLHRMKELWTYFRDLFPDSDKAIKAIFKSKKYAEYEAALRQLQL